MKLQQEREFLERKRLREEKMEEWVRVYCFELMMKIDYLDSKKLNPLLIIHFMLYNIICAETSNN